MNDATMPRSAFAVTPLNRVRKRDRAHYDRATVFAIIDAALVVHVGLIDDGRPVVLPMICARVDETLYLHGARAARLFKTLSDRVPVCITATHVDGLVVARSAFHHSINYRSAVVHGRARQVVERPEREAALTAVTNHLLPGRWDEVRPMTEKELAATAVLAVEIEAASAKVRSGPPVDDEEDYELPIWAGVVPVTMSFGVPYDDGRLAATQPIPASIDRAIAVRRR